MISLRLLVCVVLVAAAPAPAAPFIPASDGEVLERLPFPAGDPLARELRALRGRLTREPDNLPIAVRLARRYIELGRTSGDPRYAGYAEAALAPWWRREPAPREVLVLRATLRQRLHQFDAALADLAAVLAADPRNLQARLTRATVLQVQGDYEGARVDCKSLQNLAPELVSATCLASVNGAAGKLDESYAQLQAALASHPDAGPEIRSWTLTALAEMAVRAGYAAEAEAQFRAALALDAADYYLLGAYADFLLDEGRPQAVLVLLREKTRADPLLLRYALALQAEGSTELPARVSELQGRFDASRLRGGRVHLREEARFTLKLLNAPEAALRLARGNWRVQKEPADVRILLEAALAAGDAEAVEEAKQWLRTSRLEDVRLQRLMAPGG